MFVTYRAGLIFILILTLFAMLNGRISSEKCENSELSSIYLNSAIEMMKKAKDCYPREYLYKSGRPKDCDDVLSLGFNKSGIYTIWPSNRNLEGKSVEVYCDMVTDGGGWTLIQRRGNFQRPTDYFYKDWQSYKEGFGDLDKEFWLGNDNIFAITNQKLYSARFDLWDVEGKWVYAHYDFFWIDDEYHKYMLHIKDYTGNAGDSMYPKHNEMMFSTKDQKNDKRENVVGCAVSFKGAWWYNDCHDSNLNGFNLRGKHETHANGINWRSFKGHKESLEKTEIKVRARIQRRHTSQTPE